MITFAIFKKRNIHFFWTIFLIFILCACIYYFTFTVKEGFEYATSAFDDITYSLNHTQDSMVKDIQKVYLDSNVNKVVNSVRKNILPLITANINIDIGQIMKDPTIQQYKTQLDLSKNTLLVHNLITQLQTAGFKSALDVLQYVKDHSNDKTLAVDPNYATNITNFSDSLNQMIGGFASKIPTIKTNLDVLYANILNGDKTNLNNAIIAAFVQDNPDIPNANILVQNIFNLVLQHGNKLLILVSDFLKYNLLQ